eukprot:gene25358-biopygen20977
MFVACRTCSSTSLFGEIGLRSFQTGTGTGPARHERLLTSAGETALPGVPGILGDPAAPPRLHGSGHPWGSAAAAGQRLQTPEAPDPRGSRPQRLRAPRPQRLRAPSARRRGTSRASRWGSRGRSGGGAAGAGAAAASIDGGGWEGRGLSQGRRGTYLRRPSAPLGAGGRSMAEHSDMIFRLLGTLATSALNTQSFAGQWALREKRHRPAPISLDAIVRPATGPRPQARRSAAAVCGPPHVPAAGTPFRVNACEVRTGGSVGGDGYGPPAQKRPHGIPKRRLSCRDTTCCLARTHPDEKRRGSAARKTAGLGRLNWHHLRNTRGTPMVPLPKLPLRRGKEFASPECASREVVFANRAPRSALKGCRDTP